MLPAMESIELLASMGFTAIEVPLTQGKWAVIDLADAPEVLSRRWYAQKRPRGIFYAATRPTHTSLLYMHVLISGGAADQTDHRDRNGLNNRRGNLRTCEARQNQGNAQLRADNTSGFRGVSLWKGKWIASIRINGKRKHIGSFDTPEAAAHAYDETAKRVFGEFAALNFHSSDHPA
jgi:hypothetical protein